jgi:hypothetical protein
VNFFLKVHIQFITDSQFNKIGAATEKALQYVLRLKCFTVKSPLLVDLKS